MAIQIRRREFITLLSGATATWPLSARRAAAGDAGDRLSEQSGCQQPPLFRRGLSETGYIDGRNVAIEYRWADGQYDRLPMLASELVTRRVTVIRRQAAMSRG